MLKIFTNTQKLLSSHKAFRFATTPISQHWKMPATIYILFEYLIRNYQIELSEQQSEQRGQHAH